LNKSKGDSDGSEVLLYPIGAVARLIGVSPAVLRLWEREGLISPRRTRGGHRFYTAEDVARLRKIIHLRRVERLNIAAIRRELGEAADAPHGERSEAAATAGRRLRALRLRQGLSLAEVAARTGLSTSFLSAVERGLARISLANLFKLADAYGTTVPGLTAVHRRAARRLVHPEERPRFVAAQGLVVIEDLITRPGALEAQRIEIQPGGGSEEAYAHPGEEFIYVLSGQLAFWIDESEYYLLQAGDSLYFPSTCLHRWRNDGDGPATVLWINVPLIEPPAEGSRASRGRSRLGARPRPGRSR
jgi:DNA-binding transcriptional MerR regulator/quercetin dioxygenase-like cupin family protein